MSKSGKKLKTGYVIPRRLDLARSIAFNFAQTPGAGTIRFLGGCLGEKLKVTQAEGLRSGMIFKKPARTVFDSHYTWSAQLAFSLYLNLLQQNLHSQLNRASYSVLMPIVDRPMTAQAVTLGQAFAVGKHSTTILSPAIEFHRESNRRTDTIENNLRLFTDRRSESRTNETITRTVKSETFLPAESKWIVPSMRTRVGRQRDEYLLRTETSHLALLRQSEQREVTQSINLRFGEQAISLIKPFNPAFNLETSSARLPANGYLRVELDLAAGKLPVSLLDNKPVGMIPPEIERAGESQRQGENDKPVLMRREERLLSEPLDYVYARPLRSHAAEEQMIRRIEEKEVVEVVKKEVQTLMSPGSVMQSFSRTDYARIADHVYSTLVRRLLAEKERIGLR
jgi:hypothetical protein